MNTSDRLTGSSAERATLGKSALLRSGASMLAMGSLLLSSNVLAQEAAQEPAEPQTEAEVADEDVIVVSGIRASLISAQNIKRNADTVVDAITADDIGALADRSVTEALQRVPGVAINRFAGSNDPDHFSVEGSGVTIRGLNYVRSEFNGRTAFSAGVGGQALNFADVPPELLGSVIINKNSTAAMIEGGISGTVNLVTRKPLDERGFKIAFSAEGNYGDFAKKWSPTVSGLISNTWETDAGTFGILASGTFSRIRSRADGIQVTNFQARDNTLVAAANTGGALTCRNALPVDGDSSTLPPGGAPCGTLGAGGPDGFADLADLRFAPLGPQFRSQQFDRKRDGFSVAAQFESIDERTVVTAEFIRSHTTNSWGEHTFETGPDLAEYNTYPIGCLQNENGPGGTARAECPVGGFENYVYDDTGLFQSGYITSPNNGWRGDPGAGAAFTSIGGLQQVLSRRQVEDETTNEDYSLNLRTELTDRLTIRLDAQYATSRKENLDFSVFGSTFADSELDLTGDLPVGIPHIPNFTSYSWQGGPNANLDGLTDAEYFVDPRVQFWRAAMDHIEDSEGEQFAFQADIDYDFGYDSFIRKAKVGARFSERDTTVRYTTYNWGVLSEVWGANGDVVRFGDTDPSNYEVHDFDNFFRGETAAPPAALYYSGDLIDGYDEATNFALGVNQEFQNRGGPAGWVPLAQRPGALNGSPFIPSDIQRLKQRDTAAYAMLEFGSDDLLGDVRFAGNIGVRYVNLDTRSFGNLSAPSAQQLGIADPFSVRCTAQGPTGPVPSTEPLCLQGEAAYNNLRAFAGNGTGGTNSVRGDTFDYFLPSLNLRFGLTEDLILRFAASKVLTRPDNALLRNFLDISLDQSGNLTAQGGNADLAPATAWTYDASLEWYFAPVGSLTFNAFYKDIDNFFFQDLVNQEVTNNGITQNVLVRGPANFQGGGKIKGFEVAYQQTYDFLPAPFDGLGVQANYTYIDSDGLPNTFLNGPDLANESTVAPAGNLPLEQLSKHNINATVFYEKGPVSVRAAYNWRSRFLLTASDVIFPFYSIFNEETGQLDGSIFFKLSDEVQVGVQGVNLLNETTETLQAYTGDANVLAPRSFFTNDRRFSFILRGKF
ncbi:TonB-dependent receptor [Pontixanthobacter rizhaonensis]